MKKLISKARYLLALVSLVLLGANVAVAEEKTATFSLVEFTAGNPVTITSSDNTEVSLQIGRSDNSSNVSAADKSRGLRVQSKRYFTITVPEGTYVTKAIFTSNSQGNPKDETSIGGSNSTVGVWSITGENNYWNLGAKTTSYTWTNGGTNFSSPITFQQEGTASDVYICAVEVHYDEQPKLPDVAPTISIPASYSGDTKHDIQLKATVEGLPAPTIQWYSCDDASGSNAQEISEATAATYTFMPSAAGTYYFYAKATNIAGEAQSDVTTVTVINCYTATFAKEDNASIIGTAPAVLYTNSEYKLTIPANYSLILEGNTLASWKDEANTVYELGKEYQLTEDIVLTPTFTTNARSLANSDKETTVNFIKKTSTAVTYESSEQNAIVEQVTVCGETIDVALVVKGGKFDLQPSDSRAQTNNGTTISIPVTNGAKVVINIYDNNDQTFKCQINGEDVANYLAGKEGDKTRLMTYTYNGNASYIDYVVNNSNMYANSIDVTYPKTMTYIDVTSAGYRTFASGSALDFTGGVEGLTAYRAEINGDNVSFVEIDGAVPAKEGMLIKAEEGRYYIPLATGTPAEIENKFIGVTAKTEVDKGSFVLFKDDTHEIGFYKTTAEKFEVGANTAYLPAIVSAARTFIALPGGETTGVNAVESVEATDSKFFDLQGRQVSKPTKGLYISNGKKYIVK